MNVCAVVVEAARPVALATVLAVCLAVVHVFASKVRFLNVRPRSVWLSFAGGIAVSYVFVHLLPELESHQRDVERYGFAHAYLRHHVYVMALVGLSVFYGLNRLVRPRQSPCGRGPEDESLTSPIFWIHIGSFAVYNATIGYLLLHREQPGTRSLLLFAVAMGMHFLTNDYGLRRDHKGAYDHVGRWVLGAAVLIGFAVGWAVQVHPLVLALIFSFLAGGVILNVLKEELPEEAQNRFWAFAAGALLYTVVLMLI